MKNHSKDKRPLNPDISDSGSDSCSEIDENGNLSGFIDYDYPEEDFDTEEMNKQLERLSRRKIKKRSNPRH